MQRCRSGRNHMCVGNRTVLHDWADSIFTYVQSHSWEVAPLWLYTAAGSHRDGVACLKHIDVTHRGVVHMCIVSFRASESGYTHYFVQFVKQDLHNNLQRSAHIVLSNLHATNTWVHKSDVHSWCISIMHQSQSQWCRQIASYRPLSQKFTTV